ncbi:MAG: peptide ABC transporter substrate-binding protein [Anaerolineales bacterium]|nr:peptide ABC transporter substrate-binding protein [Anaerolineales bacterium]
MNKFLRIAPAMLVLVALVVSLLPAGVTFANDTEFTFTANYRQDVPVQVDGSSSAEISTLDPALADDVVSINPIENLYLGLTDVDTITGGINAELATSWEVSEDGTVWTFNLRNDVMWVRYDPATGEAEALRPVVAGDFVYGIQRACDSRLGSYYGSIAATVVAGCDVAFFTPVEEMTDELAFGDTVGVSAPDDQTVVIELQFAAGYFFSMSSMWMLRPMYREGIEEYGDEFFTPGNIVTNGPFFLEENVRGVRRVFVRNNDLPADLYGGDGNIERIVTTVIEDAGTTFALYQDNQLDSSGVPPAERQQILADPEYADQVHAIYDNAVAYFSFAYDKPPFDNVHARRAFSAIIDREAFVQQIRQGLGVPMIHFTPPSMFGAPPINEVGIGFDPEYAAAELAEAGYPNCEGFPNIDMITQSGTGTWAEFWAAAAEQYLGCDPSLINVEQLEFSVYLTATSADTPTQDRANTWNALWGPDYQDANNWVGDVLSCHVENRQKRPCDEVDDLIDQAARESDPDARIELYAEIEEALFGAEGTFPIAPIYLRFGYTLYKPWYTGPFETDGSVGGIHYGAYTIDMAAKLAARG